MGEGGPAVGAFAVSVPGPAAFVWTNRDRIASIRRDRGVTLEWEPLAQDSVMLIALSSADAPKGVWGACYCAAAGAAGRFTIPPEMLANLPATHPPFDVAPQSLFLMSFLPRNQQPIRARGLDRGVAMSIFVESINARVE